MLNGKSIIDLVCCIVTPFFSLKVGRSWLYNLLFLFVCVSEPYVTEDELKLMLRGAELSGAIEEEEQV